MSISFFLCRYTTGWLENYIQVKTTGLKHSQVLCGTPSLVARIACGVTPVIWVFKFVWGDFEYDRDLLFRPGSPPVTKPPKLHLQLSRHVVV